MRTQTTPQPPREVRFRPLGGQGGGYAFPCDAQGQVDLDALSDSARNDYLFARAFRGRAFSDPTVEAVES